MVTEVDRRRPMHTVSLSRADVGKAESAHVFAAWSNLVTGTRPEGLDECFLLEGDGVIQVVGMWDSAEAHDRALADEANHPAFVVFEAAGVEVSHTVMEIVGSFRA
jgi:hypothetical protein